LPWVNNAYLTSHSSKGTNYDNASNHSRSRCCPGTGRDAGCAEGCSSGSAVRLILGHDHRLFADALADVLPRHRVIVTARARSPRKVLMALATEQADMCLISDRWLKGERLGHLRQVREHHPAVDLVILSDRSTNCDIATARAIGAAAVVSQHQHVADLLAVLHRVRAGERAIDAAIAPEVGSFSPYAGAYIDSLLDTLTIREQEVLMLMTDGKATKEIASALAITLHTARTHVQSVLVKLGVHSRLEASGLVARSGLLGPCGQFGFSPVTHEAAMNGWQRANPVFSPGYGDRSARLM
jgi:two-component system, NarL family, nitrate/nitrite response regulator NarL